MNNRNGQSRRLMDAIGIENGINTPRPPAPESVGQSHKFVCSKIGSQEIGTIIQNQADDIDVQLVTFSVDANSNGASRTITPVIRLEWGSGGTQHKAEINVKKGTIFTVGCSMYRIVALAENISEEDIGTALEFRASAAYGSHPGAREPTREFLASILAFGGVGPAPFIEFEIPAYAIRASVLGDHPIQLDNGTVVTEFYGDFADIGHTVYTGPGAYGLRDMTFGDDHKVMRVTNNSAFAMNVMAQFELAF